MATLLIAMSLEPGHVLPTVRLAQHLQLLGHKVYYLSSGRMTLQLALLGLQAVKLSTVQVPAYLDRSLGGDSEPVDKYYDAIISHSARHSTFADVMEEEILIAAKRCRADCVLLDAIKDWDGTLSLRIQRSYPVLRLCIHFRSLTALRSNGAAANLAVMCPAALELPRFVDSDIWYGDAGYRRGVTWSWFSRKLTRPKRPLAYVTFGSQWKAYPRMPGVCETIREAATALAGWDFAFADNISQEYLGSSVPRNIASVPFRKQQDVLRSATLIITHGGLGTIKDSIYNQVPILALPQLWDQPLNALRIEQHGLGIGLSDAVTKATLREAMIAVKEELPRFHARLGEMRTAFVAAEEEHSTVQWCNARLRSL